VWWFSFCVLESELAFAAVWQGDRRRVLSDSQNPPSPGKDIRALFDKVKLRDGRYRTFAAQKTPQNTEPTYAAPQAAQVVPAAPAASHPRRALQSVFDVNARLRIAPHQAHLAAGSGAALIFASCAGGVGKTTLCATIARVLSARLTSVLIADRCPQGIMPYYFGLERLSAGGLQTVYPNARRAGYQMVMVNTPCEEQPNTPTAAWLERLQAESTLTLMDVPTLNNRSLQEQMIPAGYVVIPLVPDVQSIASIARVEALSDLSSEGQNRRCLFVLNRYDEARPLHREIRNHLEKVLEERLAPLAVRESEYVPEALSLGMTVLDHVPQSPVANDFEQLAAWLEARLLGPAEILSEKVEIA
jgi:cellulose synthase operon protein YhjQ